MFPEQIMKLEQATIEEQLKMKMKVVKDLTKRESNVSTTPYAANMAQPLADLHVPGASNKAGTTGDRRTAENENESCQGPHERESNVSTTPYAANMAQPLADLHVPGASNKAGASDDRRTETDVGNRQASGHQREATARRRGRNPYFELAADMSGPLSEIRVPGTSDDRSAHRDARMQTQRQATESFPLQQSPSEYQPNASCGSSCEQSSFQSEAHSEGEMGHVHDHRQQESWTCQDEGTQSVVQQESLSEYNEDATCGSGFYRSDSEFSNYSNVQTAEFESTNQGSDGFPSKFPSEIDSTHKECHSQVDGEPFSKRIKPNPEVTEELSFPQPETSYMDSTTVGDTEFGSRQESIPVLFTVESKQNESFPIQSEEEISTRNSEGHTPLESCLSSELENMSLEDGYSVDTGASFDYSAAERSVPVSQSYQGIDNLIAILRVLDRRQGKRCPEERNPKRLNRTPRTLILELAKEIAGDFSAMNSQLENANAKTHRAANERSSVREEELFDGGSIVQTMTPDATSLHAPPLEQEQRDARQQPSLINNEGLRGRDASDQRDTAETAESRATSRQTRHDVAAERRSQVEEQQRLIDNMAPELQALVVQMIQREEEEQRGHVLHGTHLNPPVPPRLLSQRRGENDNQGACAEGALKQPEGKKSRKGSKTKGHYFELAGIMAPQLATVNAAMVNGHVEGQQGRTTGHDGRTEGNHSNGFAHGAARECHHVITHVLTSPYLIQEPIKEKQLMVEEDEEMVTENMVTTRILLAKRTEDSRGSKKNPKRRKRTRAACYKMAESMAESLQDLNARLEEQQRQQRSLNGHGAAVRPLSPGNESGMELVPDESVTRDSSSDVTNKSTSSRKEHGHK
ncbi:hypothetical protein OS493_024011 [Desmophyllum pertusum]|uniref:Uncharacterized protein n=1 Tax=Desmophyllum pertusum TaxID=174260 RepID=A0A9W9ZZA7_9CNID|nr:hypothetical protein OS493_024011 [Desmophyllum pertusum]